MNRNVFLLNQISCSEWKMFAFNSSSMKSQFVLAIFRSFCIWFCSEEVWNKNLIMILIFIWLLSSSIFGSESSPRRFKSNSVHRSYRTFQDEKVSKVQRISPVVYIHSGECRERRRERSSEWRPLIKSPLSINSPTFRATTIRVLFFFSRDTFTVEIRLEHRIHSDYLLLRYEKSQADLVRSTGEWGPFCCQSFGYEKRWCSLWQASAVNSNHFEWNYAPLIMRLIVTLLSY